MIEICNFANTAMKHPWDFRVDRMSPVGNPYRLMDECYRKNVCDKYETYFYEQLRTNSKFKGYIRELLTAYITYGQLRLFCWCAPKRCHAETIKSYLNKCKEANK